MVSQLTLLPHQEEATWEHQLFLREVFHECTYCHIQIRTVLLLELQAMVHLIEVCFLDPFWEELPSFLDPTLFPWLLQLLFWLPLQHFQLHVWQGLLPQVLLAFSQFLVSTFLQFLLNETPCKCWKFRRYLPQSRHRTDSSCLGCSTQSLYTQHCNFYKSSEWSLEYRNNPKASHLVVHDEWNESFL